MAVMKLNKVNFFAILVQWKPLNVLTLVLGETDNIIGTITISKSFI